MVCHDCGTENRDEAKFCHACGATLGLTCPACGAPYEPGHAFCEECGARLTPEASVAAAAPATPTAERRLVSVLFADLVGFTSLAESRDAEDVRELLSRYFETSRRLIERYGGTVEKFIGDAVMAVWGTPVAQEDDAERAVRTALDLVTAVTALGDELDAPELAARAGVLTGEAAVTIGAAGEGMVAGDLVNTASRVQSAAEPGNALVGEATKRASEAAIAYEDAGVHELKGKAEPLQLWRALRVTATRAGALKSQTLEPPFVGRERELRLVKELFHASAEERKAHLVSVTGIAGIGKSRLAWEFYKYLDGLVDTMFWHRGRCLAYGEGVTYWALAEMVRMRAQIAEAEPPETARRKLRETVAQHVPDLDDRAWVEPRLAHLVGLEEGGGSDRQDLFAAWRLFFERLAEQNPVVLVFEDMQWADAALLAFVEYLLEWSGNHPLYVVTLARPELAERFAGFGRGVRNATTLALEPLSDNGIRELLDGLVPGLPDELVVQILDRAQGIPLYAVETVRMLLDRGLLEREGERYRPTGLIEALEIPETLHALVAARLDGLEAGERRLVQDASVLGKTFTREALAAVAGGSESDLEPLLTALMRKEILSVQGDPRSPERGQYSFLQDLLRQVAYETLAKRDRKTRHLSAAAYLEEAFKGSEHEIAEVVASHYVAAYEAEPGADDAADIQAKAREALAQAGERAASLGAPDEAQRYFEQAAALADDVVAEADLLRGAGENALRANRLDESRDRLERAVAIYEERGEQRRAAGATAALALLDLVAGRLDDAVSRLEPAVAALAEEEPGAELAEALHALGRVLALRGQTAEAVPHLERALMLAETLALEGLLVHALTSKAIVCIYQSRPIEGRILLEAARERALAAGLYEAALRATNNLCALLENLDRYDEELPFIADALALSRRIGDRLNELNWITGSVIGLVRLGRWDEALARADEADRLATAGFQRAQLISVVEILCARGEVDATIARLAGVGEVRETTGPEPQANLAAVESTVRRAEGRYADALEAAERGLKLARALGATTSGFKFCLVEALEASFALGDLGRVEELLGRIAALRPGEVTPYIRGHGARFRARLAAAHEGEGVEPEFATAEATFREFGFVFHLAVTLLEHGEWLFAQGEADAEPLVTEAREIFTRLKATPWLERAEQVAARGAAEAVQAR